MRTQVPNEMLLNPAVSLLSSPNTTTGPLTVAGNVQGGSPVTNFVVSASSNDLILNADAGQVRLSTGGTPRWMINSAGNLLAATDNTNDIGADGVNRPRTIYAGTSVVAAAGTSKTTIGAVAATGAYMVGGQFGTVQFGSNGNPKWVIGPNSEWAPFNDATVDIGRTGQAPRDIYVSRDPTLPLQVTTKQYVDGKVGTLAYLPLTGGTLSQGVGNGLRFRPEPNFAAAWNIEQNASGSIDFLPAASASFGAGVWVYSNGYFDGTDIQAWNTANSVDWLNISTGGISHGHAAAGTNPASGRIQWVWGVNAVGSAGASMFIGSANERIRNPVNSATHLSVESADGYGFFSSKQGTHVGGNAWWDGTNWQRYDTTAGSTVVIASTGGILFQTAVAGTGVLAQTTKMTIDLAGSIGLRTPPLTGYGLRMAGLGETSATYGYQHVNSAANRNIFYTRDDGYVYMQGPMQLDGAATIGGVLNTGQINTPYIVTNGIDVGTGPIYFKNNGSYYINWDGGSYFQAVNMNVMSWGGFYFNGNGGIYLGGWDGTWIHSSHGIMLNSGSYGFGNNGGVYWNFDGTWIRAYGATGIGTSGNYYWMANNAAVGLYWDGTWVNIQPRAWAVNEMSCDIGIIRNGSSGLRFVDDNVREVRPTSTNQLKTYVYDAWHQWHRAWDNTSMGYIDINGFHNGSTIKNKHNLREFRDGLSLVKDSRVKPRRYTMTDVPRGKGKGKGNRSTHERPGELIESEQVGFIAEEMVEIIPEVVGLDPETGEPAGINYGALVPILWDAVRTLSARVELLEKQGV